jgi:hypothetical protein
LDDYIKKSLSTNAQTSTGSEEQEISVLNSETVEQVELPEQVQMELMSEEEIEDEISISSDEELLTIDADCQTEASHYIVTVNRRHIFGHRMNLKLVL